MYTIHIMNIKKINLNLLIALDALLSEQNVSRAADKIFITQPAMSNSLTQLRQLFNDKLLVRSGNKMKLTPLAEDLSPKIKNILDKIEETVINREPFDPKNTKRLFRIGISDYGEFVFLSHLAEKLALRAPNISFKLIHMNTLSDPTVFLEGKIDLGIGINQLDSPAINSEELFAEEAVCVARGNHPLMKNLTLKNYLSAKHLAIAYQDENTRTVTDLSLQEFNVTRDIVIAVPHMLAALFALPQTSYIATVPKRLGIALKKTLKLTIQKPPFKIPTVIISQAWHKRFDNDQGHLWLRQIIKEIAEMT